jgi:hypothetical protein
VADKDQISTLERLVEAGRGRTVADPSQACDCCLRYWVIAEMCAGICPICVLGYLERIIDREGGGGGE